MSDGADISGYIYEDGELNNSHSYLLPALKAELAMLEGPKKTF